MKSIVVPISDPGNAGSAAKHVVDLYRRESVRVHLLSVQHPLSRDVARFFHSDQIRDFHRDNGMLALKPAIDLLDAADVPHWDHVLVGHKAETIVRFAQDHHCSQIILANHNQGLLSSLGLGSIGSQIRHLIGANNICDVCEVT